MTAEIDDQDDRCNPEPATLACPACGGAFTRRRHWQRFCSDTCRKRHHRSASPDGMLLGMISAARSLGLERDAFLTRIEALWPMSDGGSEQAALAPASVDVPPPESDQRDEAGITAERYARVAAVQGAVPDWLLR